jgi:hypothetical protein
MGANFTNLSNAEINSKIQEWTDAIFASNADT